MKYFSYLNTAAELIRSYTGQQPFQFFIKDFFRQHKKYGSTDRKQITHLCYCCFRLGKTLNNIPLTEKIVIALFLCSNESNDLLAHLKPVWNEKVSLTVAQKLELTGTSSADINIFPVVSQISSALSIPDFILSHLTQPDVFLRIRPGYQQQVVKKLEQSAIGFSLESEDCIRLAPGAKAETIADINKEVVVQDFSSQRTGDFLRLLPATTPRTWDCCAASGGKSIMAKDILGNIDLTVSDIREQIIINLKKRLDHAGVTGYKAIVSDLSGSVNFFRPGSFGLIIADVPCTGSGTWGRTPDRLSFFDEKEIDRYQQLQKRIIATVLPYLEENGYLLYITCSVYKKENEDMVDFIVASGATIVKTAVLKGYHLKADTMFAALVKKK